MRYSPDTHRAERQGDRCLLALAAAIAILEADRAAPGSGRGLPEALRDYYTEGACEDLADALHFLTGWPVAVIGDMGGVAGWVHAGVQAPNGDILDADGRHERWDWLDSWAPWVDAYGEALEGYDPEMVDIVPRRYFTSA